MPGRLSRREMLALVGSAAAAAVAGCQTGPTSGNSSGDGDGSTPASGDDGADATATATAASTPNETATGTKTPRTTTVEPVREYFEVGTNDTTKTIEIEFASDDRMQVFEIEIGGAERSVLNQTDFEERTVEGGYVYSGQYRVSREGAYNLSFTRLVGANIDDPPYNRTRTVRFDLTPPALLSFRPTHPSASQLQVRLVADERLDGLSVEILGVGGYSEDLSRRDFTESETSEGYAYEATLQVDRTGRYLVDLVYIEDLSENRNEIAERYYAHVD